MPRPQQEEVYVSSINQLHNSAAQKFVLRSTQNAADENSSILQLQGSIHVTTLQQLQPIHERPERLASRPCERLECIL